MAVYRWGAALAAAAWLSLAPAGAEQNWFLFQPPAPNPSPSMDRGNMPADADIYYSTPKATDDDVNFQMTTRRTVADPTHEPPGTLTVSTHLRRLFLSLPGGEALEYKIAVGRQGFSWKGNAEIGRKAYWPGWTPPPEMLARDPSLPAHVDGGMGNPLGARALYLFEDHKDTLFRIHGTNEPKSIGHAVSSGCIRMLNADVIDLYGRVQKGTKVVVE
jgi:lipoprotein-anchoring transpeptidase ErfK/SrfK